MKRGKPGLPESADSGSLVKTASARSVDVGFALPSPPRVVQPNRVERASIVILLRSRDGKFESVSDLKALLNRSELFLIQRQFSKRDHWAGQIAFPGGHAEKNESDYDAALRECVEEVGIDLDNGDYAYVGQLRDRNIGPVIVSTFCFVQLVPNEDATVPVYQENEVARSEWVDLRHFDLETELYCSAPYYYPVRRFTPRSLRTFGKIMGLDALRVPAIYVTFGHGTAFEERQKGYIKPMKNGKLPVFGMALGVVADLFEVARFNTSFCQRDSIRFRNPVVCLPRNVRRDFVRGMYGCDDEFWKNPYLSKKKWHTKLRAAEDAPAHNKGPGEDSANAQNVTSSNKVQPLPVS